MNQFKKNLTYNFILSISQIIYPIITIPYISQILLPEELGKVGLIDSYSMFFVNIAEFGMITYAIREIVKVKNDVTKLRNTFFELLSIQLITSLFALLLYFISIDFISKKVIDQKIIYLSVFFLFSNFFYTEWYYWGTEQFKYIAIRTIIIRFLGVFAIYFFVRSPHDGLWYYAIIVLTVTSIIWLNFGKILFQHRFRFTLNNFKKHFSVLIKMNGISIIYGFYTMLDITIASFVISTYQMGIYVLSLKFIRTVSLLITDLFYVLLPFTINEVNDNSMEIVVKKLRKSSNLILFFSIPISLGIYLLSNEISANFFGSAFMSVGNNLRWLSVFPLLVSYQLFLSRQILISFNKEKDVLVTLSWGLIVFILGFLLLPRIWDVTGACMAIVASELFLVIRLSMIVKKVLGSHSYWDNKTFYQIVISSIAFIPLLYFISELFGNTIWAIIIGVVTCMIFYVSSLTYLFKNEIAVNLIDFIVSYFKKTRDLNS